MKCLTAMGLMAAYVEQRLPEQTARALAFHIQVCEECHTEYTIWKESSMFFKTGVNVPPELVPSTTMAEEIMARIVKEEKWALPTTKRLKTIQPNTKKLTTSLSFLFLLVFGVLIFSSFHMNAEATVGKGEWKELTSKDIVFSIDQMRASHETKPETKDIRYRIVASIGDPIHLDHASALVPNLGLVAGFFGIMVTVVGMNWLSRN